MTLAMPNKRGKKKREEMELPANVRRGLIAHSEGLSWIEASKVANLTPHAMRQWRKHPDAENFINHAINSSLEESFVSVLAKSSTFIICRISFKSSKSANGCGPLSKFQAELQSFKRIP